MAGSYLNHQVQIEGREQQIKSLRASLKAHNKQYFLFAHFVDKKTKQPIKDRAPIQIGRYDFKMSHEQVVAFKNAMVLHAYLIYVITEA